MNNNVRQIKFGNLETGSRFYYNENDPTGYEKIVPQSNKNGSSCPKCGIAGDQRMNAYDGKLRVHFCPDKIVIVRQ